MSHTPLGTDEDLSDGDTLSDVDGYSYVPPKCCCGSGPPCPVYDHQECTRCGQLLTTADAGCFNTRPLCEWLVRDPPTDSSYAPACWTCVKRHTEDMEEVYWCEAAFHCRREPTSYKRYIGRDCVHCGIINGGTVAYAYARYRGEDRDWEIGGALCACCSRRLRSGQQTEDPATCGCMQHKCARSKAADAPLKGLF